MSVENAPEQPVVAPEIVQQAQAELADAQGVQEPEKPRRTRKRVESDPQPTRIGRTFAVLPTNRSLIETFPSDEEGPESFEAIDPQPEDFEEYVRAHGRWDR